MKIALNLRFQRYLESIFCFVPFVIYALFFVSIAHNVNYFAYDDINVLKIIGQWHGTKNWSEKLDWLSVGFPGHRIVFTRTLVLCSYWLTGRVSLLHLMCLANLLWVGQLFVLYRVFRPLHLSLIYFAPLCWLLLNVHSFENIFWGTSSLGNFGVLFFTMLAAYFYTHHAPKNLAWALFFSVVATFTYGNGLLCFIIGGFILTFTKQWTLLGKTVAVFLITMLLYAFTRAYAVPSNLDLTHIANYGFAISCFFGFIGSSVNFNPYSQQTYEIWISIAWGAVLFGVILWFLRNTWLPIFKGRWPDLRPLSAIQQFALFLFLFVCLSGVGVVYNRANDDGLVGMFKGRYRMYATWLLAITYLMGLTRWVKNPAPLLRCMLPVSVFLNLIILYNCFAPAVNNRRQAVAQEFNSMFNADLLGLRMFGIPRTEFLKLQQLYQPKLFFDNLRPQLEARTIRAIQKWPLDSVYWQKNDFVMSWHKDFLQTQKDFDDGAYVIIQSVAHVYMAAGGQQSLPIRTFFRRGWYWNRGFTASFNKNAIMSGKYQIFVLVRQNGINQLYDTDKTVVF